MKKLLTESQIQKAKNVNLEDFLQRNGEILTPSGSEMKWVHDGEQFSVRQNLWYNHYRQEGGNAIKLVQSIYGLSFSNAVLLLLGESIQTDPHHLFRLPPKFRNMNRVSTYLCYHRGIDRSVVSMFSYHNLIYESSDYHNAVFVGYDRNGFPRHAALHGIGSETTFKGNAPNGNADYSFHWVGNNETIYLFEAPIDLLSFITMNPVNWIQNNYAASCSVSDRVLTRMLHDYPHIKNVVIAFDNDTAGLSAGKRIADKLFVQGIKAQALIPHRKDWNEDLLYSKDDHP